MAHPLRIVLSIKSTPAQAGAPPHIAARQRPRPRRPLMATADVATTDRSVCTYTWWSITTPVETELPLPECTASWRTLRNFPLDGRRATKIRGTPERGTEVAGVAATREVAATHGAAATPRVATTDFASTPWRCRSPRGRRSSWRRRNPWRSRRPSQGPMDSRKPSTTGGRGSREFLEMLQRSPETALAPPRSPLHPPRPVRAGAPTNEPTSTRERGGVCGHDSLLRRIPEQRPMRRKTGCFNARTKDIHAAALLRSRHTGGHVRNVLHVSCALPLVRSNTLSQSHGPQQPLYNRGCPSSSWTPRVEGGGRGERGTWLDAATTPPRVRLLPSMCGGPMSGLIPPSRPPVSMPLMRKNGLCDRPCVLQS